MPTGGVLIPARLPTVDIPVIHARIRAAVLHANRTATWVTPDAKYDERRLTPKQSARKRKRESV